jgi:glyoxylase-like metal-dependent hydrolase (beta-lactamase superfamily II)/rhodanese-related sulfurtransferase
MILRQYYLGCLAQASYLVADERSGRAAIVDPRRDVDVYLEDLRQLGLTLDDVFLTHFHADFVSGHLELRERTGCRIRLGARARAGYEFVPVRDGEVVDLGAVRLRILETPGHTPESISIVVYDRDRDAERPVAVLTGDALFVGDVGRPDLLASHGASGDGLARELYRSLRDKLLALPDATLVYPGHGAGSMCGKSLGQETCTTIGEQRRDNYALQHMSEDDFVTLVTSDQPEPPAYFAHDITLNRSERPTLPAVLARDLRPLPLSAVLALVSSGAQLLDVREPAAFAAGHLAGSVNIGLSGKFATWAGSLLARERPIVVVAEPGREPEAVTRLARIGLDDVAGFLEGGMAALRDAPNLVTQLPRLTAAELAVRLASPRPPVVVDVRTAAEREARAIAGSRHVPLAQLQRLAPELPKTGDLVVVCGSGYRSCIAASAA